MRRTQQLSVLYCPAPSERTKNNNHEFIRLSLALHTTLTPAKEPFQQISASFVHTHSANHLDSYKMSDLLNLTQDYINVWCHQPTSKVKISFWSNGIDTTYISSIRLYLNEQTKTKVVNAPVLNFCTLTIVMLVIWNIRSEVLSHQISFSSDKRAGWGMLTITNYLSNFNHLLIHTATTCKNALIACDC